MKTLVLNTLGNDYTEQIKALIKDKEIEIVDTSDSYTKAMPIRR